MQRSTNSTDSGAFPSATDTSALLESFASCMPQVLELKRTRLSCKEQCPSDNSKNILACACGTSISLHICPTVMVMVMLHCSVLPAASLTSTRHVMLSYIHIHRGSVHSDASLISADPDSTDDRSARKCKLRRHPCHQYRLRHLCKGQLHIHGTPHHVDE